MEEASRSSGTRQFWIQKKSQPPRSGQGPASLSLSVCKESSREHPREDWEGAGPVMEPVNDIHFNKSLSNLCDGQAFSGSLSFFDEFRKISALMELILQPQGNEIYKLIIFKSFWT